MRRIISLALSLILLAVSAAPVSAIDEDMVLASGDVFVARPLGFVSVLIGTAVFLVSLPFAATSNSVKETAEILIDEPMRFTFKRPVGDLGVGAGYGGRRQPAGLKKSIDTKPPAAQAPPAKSASEESGGGKVPPAE